MALFLKLVKIQELDVSKGSCFARVKFRDFPHHSKLFTNIIQQPVAEGPSQATKTVIVIDEEFQWPIARALDQEEVLSIEIIQERRFSGKRTVALFSMFLQRLMIDGYMKMTENFQDAQHNMIPAKLTFIVNYISPEGKFDDWKKQNQQGTTAALFEESDSEDEIDDASGVTPDPVAMAMADHRRALEDDEISDAFDEEDTLIQANTKIAKGGGIGGGVGTIARKLGLGRKEKRRKSSFPRTDRGRRGGRDESDTTRILFRSAEDDALVFTKRQQKKALTDRDFSQFVTSSLMIPENAEGDGDADLEGRSLDSRLEGAAGDGRPEIDLIGGIGGIGGRMVDAGKDMTITEGSPLKRHPYQLSLAVIECRHLRGTNINPIAFVQLGPIKKTTMKQMGTNQPYFNEFFTFDLVMPFGSVLDRVVTIGVVHKPKNPFKPPMVVGTCKIDIGTVYHANGHRYFQKWIMLHCPTDLNSGPSGFMKIDIQLSGFGIQSAPPDSLVKPVDGGDVIESNLLMPEGLFASPTQDMAKYIVRIFKADGLPQMDQGVVEGFKKVFSGEAKDLVDPFVEVSFAGISKRTTIKKNTYTPEWNEQIVFTELFPSLCRRIKFQLFDYDNVGTEECIGTHYLTLETIMNNQYNGWLPTFGPTYINLYGSSRTFSVSEDENLYLNYGYGDGVSYRGRILIQVKVDVCDSMDHDGVNVEREPCRHAPERQVGILDEFFLFGCFFDASMIHKSHAGKAIAFEMSVGNAGNNVDGYNPSAVAEGKALQVTMTDSEADEEETKSQDSENEDSQSGLEREAKDSWESLTPRSRTVTTDKSYYSVPWEEKKPCVYIRSHWEDQRARMYVQNMLTSVVKKLKIYNDDLTEEGRQMQISKTKSIFLERVTKKLVRMLDDIGTDCSKAANIISSNLKQSRGRSPLDKNRREFIKKELEYVATMARTLKVTVKPVNFLEKRKSITQFYQKLNSIVTEPQDDLPDIFIWMLASGERAAYVRIPARDIIFSINPLECGPKCGQVHTYFLRLPGVQGIGQGGWSIHARIQIYLWLGLRRHKTHFLAGLPQGYQETDQIFDAQLKQSANPPLYVDYEVLNTYELRAHLYQARNLLGMDESGLSDPYCWVCFANATQKTDIDYKNLNPIWDQLLIFQNLTMYGTIESMKQNPPAIVIEIFDHDEVGTNDFLGRVICQPFVKGYNEPYSPPVFPPKLQWYPIRRGESPGGDLLAVFELFQLAPSYVEDELKVNQLPALEFFPPITNIQKEKKLPLPSTIRPCTSWHRLEILFWGIRDVKMGFISNVRRPMIIVECAGEVIHSESIYDMVKNPNFNHLDFITYLDVPLPDDTAFCPPLTIKCVDQKTFGRYDLVGTHIVQSVGLFHIQLEEELSNSELETAKARWLSLKSSWELGDINSVSEDILLDAEDETEDIEPFEVPDETEMSRRKNEQLEETIEDGTEDLDWWSKYYETLYNLDDGVIDDVSLPNEEIENEENELKIALLEEEHNKFNPNAEAPYLAREESFRRMSARRKSRQSIQSLPLSTITDTKGSKNLKNTALTMLSKTKEEVANKYAFVNKAFAKEDDDNYSTISKQEEDSKICKIKIYPGELEKQPEFSNFDDVLRTFELYRGKANQDENSSDNRFCGKFKGNFKLYKLPEWIIDPTDYDSFQLWEDNEEIRNRFGPMVLRPSRGIPINDQKKVKVFAYILKASNLHPADISGKADPYPSVKLGNISDDSAKANYVAKSLNPIFGKCFVMEAMFPQESLLTVQIYDWDAIGSNDLIGETKVDLEKRYYSRHRAYCGISQKFDRNGYNQWRDSTMPTKILSKLCKDANLEQPVYELNSIKINGFGAVKLDQDKYNFDDEENKVSFATIKECLALEVLLKWKNKKLGGFELVPEYVESRALYLPTKPGIEQGRVEMWFDVFPMDRAVPDPVDVQPRQPKTYELRCIIWNTEDVELTDYNFLTGQKSADIYVKGWVLDDKPQSTDVHYMSLTGEGNFNWRFKFQFDYFVAEERIVVRKKASLFDLDETEFKFPARLNLQVWDLDLLGDDFIGSLIMNLKKMPRPAKSAVECVLDTVEGTKVKFLNLFKVKRAKGWWPCIQQKENEETGELTTSVTGKLEAEFHLVELAEAEEKPVGLEREAPEPLDKPIRPETSYSWFLMPLKSFWFVFLRRFKKVILGLLVIGLIGLLIFLFIYNVPGATVNAMFG